MSAIHTSKMVRLMGDLSALGLFRGEVGMVVQSLGRRPLTVYRVEFHPAGPAPAVHALLFGEQLEALQYPATLN